MIVDLSRDIFSCGTWIFVYALIHVMCFCVYVSMVCQRCMLYDDMYLHDKYAYVSIFDFLSMLEFWLLCRVFSKNHCGVIFNMR
jgi:hypothetical protein